MTIDAEVARGAAALRSGNWHDARDAFAAALAQQETPEALAGFADAVWWLGEGRRAVAHRERAHAAFRRAGDVAGATMTAVKLAIDYKSGLGNDAAAGGWLARAERLVAEADGDLGALPGHVWAARAYATADLDLAVELAGRAHRLGRELGDRDLELLGLSELGRELVAAGKGDEGMPLLDEAMAATLSGECAHLEMVVYASCAMLTACELTADLERAVQWCRAADEFVRTYGCPFLYVECRLLYGSVLVATGDWDEAAGELQAAVEAAADACPALQSRARARLADLRLRQGREEEAEALLDTVADPLIAALPAAALHLARDEPEVAVGLLQRFLARTDGCHLDTGSALSLLVEARLAAGDADAAAGVAERLADLAAQRPNDQLLAQAALAGGRVAVAADEPERAARWIEQALAHLERLDLPLDTARARVDLARSLAASGNPTAVAEARAGLAALERLGAAVDADAAAALLRSLGVSGRTGPPGGRGADPARAGGAGPGRSGAVEPRDRCPPVHQPQDGGAPRQQRPGQTGGAQPGRGRGSRRP